jgi:hypothetical protein
MDELIQYLTGSDMVYIQLLGGSYKEYDKCVVAHSIKNQLRYKGNLGNLILLFH